jgi:hypothetical protein
MIGGLLKSASRWALVAAAGIIVGGVAMPSAKAADLGGDCCADLEERVAELEATTARKGNRKMSLTITGQVHRMILGWDDGHKSDVYYGLDNTNSSSRFSFTGVAKVTPSVSMGFDITIEIEAGGTSSKVSQFDEDGKVGTQINGASAASFNASNVDAYFGDARRAAFWIEDKNLGRLTVGRYESAGAITTIDLAGISAGASASMVLVNGGFFVQKDGQYGAVTWGALGDPAANQGRTELIRYDSPTIAGFVASASIGEAGDYWGVMLRYAGEFSGFRVAAGIGYENVTDRITGNGSAGNVPGPLDAGQVNEKPDVKAWGAGLSVLHVPSGLFAQGHYMAAKFDGFNSGYWGQNIPTTALPGEEKKDANQWLIQAGITKNWFGPGNTAIFGEYSKSNDWGAGIGAGRTFAAPAGSGLVSITNVTDTTLTVWGIGVTQNIDAAATELYLNYRNFSADITGCINNVCGKASPDDFHAVIGGARVKF